MEGRQEIINAIKAEYDVGLSRLPAYGFSYMFKKKQEELTTTSMDNMIHWLSIIKQGRIVYKDPNRIKDDFFEPGALYNKLHLTELLEDELDEMRY